MYQELVCAHFQNGAKMQAYVNLIEKHNQVMNLTGFTGERLWQEGIYESLLALSEINKGKILDIGAGAGFPSIPLLIHHPQLQLTIYEPQKKRTLFLKKVQAELGLNFQLKVLRAEASPEEEVYDYVTARAVAPLRILIEIAHKSLKIGGQMLFFKGANYQQELAKAQTIMQRLALKAKVIKIKQHGIHTFMIKLVKTVKNPLDLPRAWAQIKKSAIY